MNRILLRILSLLMVVGVVNVDAYGGEEVGKKNVLFIFADDMSYEAVGIAGMLNIDTPHLDKLAARGTRFTHTYNSGGWHGAICAASRTMLNTGKRLWDARGLENRQRMGNFAKGKRTWSQRMSGLGYETYFTGKWHVSIKSKAIFDHARHERAGMPKQVKEGYNRPVEGKTDAWSPYDKKFGGFWQGGKHWSEVVGDDTIDFIEDAKGRDKPFFIYAAFNAPHDPRQSPKKYVDQYPLREVDVPADFLPVYPFKDAIGCSAKLRDEKLAPFPRTEYSVKVNRQEYYAIITHMDAQIGRILKKLEDSGMADDTYVIFTADHGLSVGHHGLLGKQNMYDHSMRVPLFIAGPAVPKGKLVDTPVYLQDAMATSLSIAGDAVREGVWFDDLLPKVRGKFEGKGKGIYGAYMMDRQRMCVYGDYKLIIYPKAQVYRLFHLKDDPKEMKSLAGQQAYAEVVNSAFSYFEKLQAEHGDTLKIDLAGYVGR